MRKAENVEIVQKKYIDCTDYDLISALQSQCEQAGDIALKLELDYKLAEAENSKLPTDSGERNEFLWFSEERLVGYIGICGFGGASGTLELTGMVHPNFRRRGIFSELFGLAMQECRRRGATNVLGLSDRKSGAGQAFLKKVNGIYHHSEFEMFLQDHVDLSDEAQLCGITLRKAVNADAHEIARQDRIYFKEESAEDTKGDTVEQVRLPEEEEKRGFTIYLALKGEKIIGKVNLQLINGTGGIYGLGVLPEERGNGYGRAILLQAIGKLKSEKASEIFLQVAADNEKALSLYLSCGFETKSVMDYFKLL